MIVAVKKVIPLLKAIILVNHVSVVLACDPGKVFPKLIFSRYKSELEYISRGLIGLFLRVLCLKENCFDILSSDNHVLNSIRYMT